MRKRWREAPRVLDYTRVAMVVVVVVAVAVAVVVAVAVAVAVVVVVVVPLRARRFTGASCFRARARFHDN